MFVYNGYTITPHPIEKGKDINILDTDDFTVDSVNSEYLYNYIGRGGKVYGLDTQVLSDDTEVLLFSWNYYVGLEFSYDSRFYFKVVDKYIYLYHADKLYVIMLERLRPYSMEVAKVSGATSFVIKGTVGLYFSLDCKQRAVGSIERVQKVEPINCESIKEAKRKILLGGL